LQLARHFFGDACNQRHEVLLALDYEPCKIRELMDVVEDELKNWPRDHDTIELQSSGLLQKIHQGPQIRTVFFSANDLGRYLQTLKLVHRQVLEESEVSIADFDRVEPIDLFGELLDAVDVVGDSCEFEQINDALGRAHKLALIAAEDHRAMLDVVVKDKPAQLLLVLIKVVSASFGQ